MAHAKPHPVNADFAVGTHLCVWELMCMCVCVCMYIHIYTGASDIHTCVYIYTQVCIYTHKCAYIHTGVHIYTQVCIYTHKCVYIYVYIYKSHAAFPAEDNVEHSIIQGINLFQGLR